MKCQGLFIKEKKYPAKQTRKDDTDAPTQGHPHPQAGILQKKIAIRRDGKSQDRTANGCLFSI